MWWRGWITKDFCLRLIISSCKNTSGGGAAWWGTLVLANAWAARRAGPCLALGGGRGSEPRTDI